DITLIGNDITHITQIKEQLHKEFSIKDLGSLNYYLGTEILRKTTGLIMTQIKYTLELLQSVGLLNVKPSSIPFDPLIKLNHDDGDPLDDPSQYRTFVGKLLYLTITRLDISYAAQTLSQFIKSLRTPYLKSLIDNWSSCSFSRRSVTGYCIFIDSCLISWKSKKLTVVSRISTKSGYRALAYVTYELSWIKCLFKDLGITIPSPTTIYCDNSLAIALASNPFQHARTKHIEIACHFVRDKIRQGPRKEAAEEEGTGLEQQKKKGRERSSRRRRDGNGSRSRGELCGRGKDKRGTT
ncbi:cysteine-rich receptor-like protein kinase 8, partial [Tanacetum coccineum]